MAQDQGELYVLLEKIQRGDQAALGIFYDATVRRVYAVAIKVTASPELAEEIVSDVFMQVWHNASSYSAERSTPLGWLLMMAHSRSIDSLRREGSATRNQMPLEEAYDAPDETTPGPLAATLGVEQHHELASALKLLDGQQRQMITLAFYRGLSHQEIANYTGEPLGTVKTTLRRAQSILRGALTATGFVQGGDYAKA
ncbi:RNA polymerase sigma factor [Thiothrix nivea]|uniref:RNA polymerase, sigma-24 subunit, ECF subfamily n=1 Tax=Thiothrix nivea (strain ATCC 35100 / DSM 5205 / JP2) TaxID=870187 RepID=A0A656HHC8_THINJ|nr:sigma-70 family RNA polymerase sigma factor [Thiothrix nivea]EIJ36421.1 RNA polymerase, sigma-24 subunit, ECF subfamily [Thiothrix nivea DSM 5205]